MNGVQELPIAIIGAGPIGLAAAANLAERGVSFRVYEAGARVGTNIRDWGHVRIFTNWEQSVDPASRRLLEASGWKLPETTALPTGDDLCRRYLQPLSALPALAGSIETDARVVAITRRGIDKVISKDRIDRPFVLKMAGRNGRDRLVQARAVIDASGTWHNPNPLGGSGVAAEGEAAVQAHLAYGMPDVLGNARPRYDGKRVAVVGSGYSAINVLLDLATLGGGKIVWVVRGRNMARIYGGGDADELAARGRLGRHLRSLVATGRIELASGFSVEAVAQTETGLVLTGETDAGGVNLSPVDEIIVATGQRPELAMTRELRLELDPWLESTKALGPMIDPNIHSCGSVDPHGHRETAHPEPGFHTIGVKSYGRAPTFLLLTGYEQARSVAAALSGDTVAADDVHLKLPDTGICTTDFDEAECCGGPSPVEAEACCVADAVAKEAGKKGCGCGAVAA
ncbi:MAG TPA: NAD(P)-binding domain-containing protein [Dongiaceae bacterium]